MSRQMDMIDQFGQGFGTLMDKKHATEKAEAEKRRPIDPQAQALIDRYFELDKETNPQPQQEQESAPVNSYQPRAPSRLGDSGEQGRTGLAGAGLKPVPRDPGIPVDRPEGERGGLANARPSYGGPQVERQRAPMTAQGMQDFQAAASTLGSLRPKREPLEEALAKIAAKGAITNQVTDKRVGASTRGQDIRERTAKRVLGQRGREEQGRDRRFGKSVGNVDNALMLLLEKHRNTMEITGAKDENKMIELAIRIEQDELDRLSREIAEYRNSLDYDPQDPEYQARLEEYQEQRTRLDLAMKGVGNRASIPSSGDYTAEVGPEGSIKEVKPTGGHYYSSPQPQGQSQETPPIPNVRTSTSSSGPQQVLVTNGQETRRIPLSRLAEAEADGYRRVD